MEKVRLVLSRVLGTPAFTQGVLKEGLTGFMCYTMERRDPNHWTGMKNLCAIPAGLYRLRMYTRDNLKHNFQLSMTGVYRNAVFSDCTLPSETTAGSICVGTACNTTKGLMKGGKEVVDKIGEWIMYIMRKGLISTKMKTGEVELLVRYDPCYFYDEHGADENQMGGQEYDDQDWNLAQ